MLKKTLLSVAIASSIALTGCLDDAETGNNADIEYKINNPDIDIREGKISPIFNPVTSELPIPNDLIWDKTAGDGSFKVPDIKPPVTTALNELSGASTTAPIDIAFNGSVDASSINADPFMRDSSGNIVYHPEAGYALPNPIQNVFLIELDYASGDPLQGLSNSEPPTVPLANHFATLLNPLATTEQKVTAITAINTAAANPTYSTELLNMNGTTVLRIHPEAPLKPRTRYIVTLTNEIKDASGTNIIPSLLYEDLTKTDEELSVGNTALFDVRKIINGLWEPVSSNVFKLNNSTRSQSGLSSLTDKNIALSYSFMTSGDEKVMEYIANPAEWFSDQITTFVRVTAAKSVTTNKIDADDDKDVDYFDVKAVADLAVASFPANPSDPTNTTIADALAPLAAGFTDGCDGATSGQTYIDCIGLVLVNAPVASGGFKELLPSPKARTVTTTSANQPISLISSPLSTLIKDPTKPPLVSQGSISIPYYLGIPTGNTAAEGAVINTESWTADNTLATAINVAFSGLGLKLPQGVVTASGAYQSNVVNYIFPFPAQSDADPKTDASDDLTIPWLAIRPYPTTPPMGTVIFQHGITTDRSASLSVGTVLAQQGYTVIAIDQAVHGIDPASTSDRLGLAATLLYEGQKGGLPDSLAPTSIENNNQNNQAVVDGTINIGFVIAASAKKGQTIDAATAQGIINTVVAGVTTGDADFDKVILTLESFENTVANAGSTIPGIANTSYERHFNFTADNNIDPVPMDFNPDTPSGLSGSLFINLKNFTNSRDKSRQGVIDLLNLRQSLASLDLNGDGTADVDTSQVYFVGHSLGTLSGIPMVSIANSVPTVGNFNASVFLEPASGIARMVENSSSFAPRIIGGLAALGVSQGSTSYEAFMNVLQATLDSVDPINFADNLAGRTTGSFQTNADLEGVLFIQNVGTADANGATVYKSDQTNPIEAETTQLTTQFGTSYKSAFAGIEQLTTLIGASDAIGANPDGSADIIRTRLGFGNHGMFVLPIVTAKEQEEKGLTDEQKAAEELRRGAAFQEGLMQTATFFLLDGEMAGASSTSGTTAVPGVLIDETTYNARPNKQLN